MSTIKPEVPEFKYSEPEQRENRQIFHELSNLIRFYLPKSTRKIDEPTGYVNLSFDASETDPLTIEEIPTIDALDYSLYIHQIPWFNLPIAAIHRGGNYAFDATSWKDTPYGPQREIAIGPDYNLYHFQNTHYFNSTGQSITFREIFQINSPEESLDEALWQQNLESNKHNIPVLEFTPDPTDSDVIKTDFIQRHIVLTTINAVKAGTFKLRV